MRGDGSRCYISPTKSSGLGVSPKMTLIESTRQADGSVSLVWLGFLRDPGICDSPGRYTYLPFYFPISGGQYGDYGNARRICKLLIVVAVFSAIHTAVLMAWFGWTLWLTTKVARTMGEPWTRDKVLKRISMGKMAKLHQWREGEDVGMGKVSSARSEEYQPQRNNHFNGLVGG